MCRAYDWIRPHDHVSIRMNDNTIYWGEIVYKDPEWIGVIHVDAIGFQDPHAPIRMIAERHIAFVRIYRKTKDRYRARVEYLKAYSEYEDSLRQKEREQNWKKK